MATSMVSGLADTADPVSSELKVDMRDQLAMLDPDTNQFQTILGKLPSEKANSFKKEWLQDRLVPRTTGLAASATSATTELVVTTSTGVYFKAGDIVRIVNTGEAVRVVSIATDTLTVVRGYGNTAVSHAAGALIDIGPTHVPQAQDFTISPVKRGYWVVRRVLGEGASSVSKA